MKLAGRRLKHTPKYGGLTKDSNAGPVWTGEVRLWEKALADPLHWREPRKIFVNSEGDLFHESIPDEWIDRVLAVMALCPQHTFQVLTKRAARMRDYCCDPRHSGEIVWPLPNVWKGCSCERQQEADERIPLLLQTPAAIRFISAEPLLGPIDLWKYLNGSRGCANCGDGQLDGQCCGDPLIVDEIPLDWVIVGGESGPDARPMHPQWTTDIRDQCLGAGVPFFFKQWGAWIPSNPIFGEFERVGKKAAGRLLDGVEHNGFPEIQA